MSLIANDVTVSGLSRHPTREDLIARAERLAPTLAERSARCEAARTAPAETIRVFVKHVLSTNS
jgi:hypothetical protein